LDVTYFRARRPGPEAAIESAVARSIPELFSTADRRFWVAASLPVGAGMPDLAVMEYEPEIVALADAGLPTVKVLAYLRAVRRARLETIMIRVGQPEKTVLRCLENLVRDEAVDGSSDVFAISSIWRRILPDVFTVEAKVVNWRKAIVQALRNRIFAHRSFVALPERVADKVREDAAFHDLGLGLLSVAADDRVSVFVQAERREPRVWTYYYQLAAAVARHINSKAHGLRNSA
jgi:hypothetical protein